MMDTLYGSSNKKGYSQNKTEASYQKSQPRMKIVQNQSPQKDDEKILLAQCYQIIQVQQSEIEKLTESINRKDQIIANLLSKSEHGRKNIQASYSISEVERLSSEMMEIYRKYENGEREKEALKRQVEILGREADRLKGLVQDMEQREEARTREIQDMNEAAGRLKEVYETKIAKLLAEIRKRVEEDVQKSIQKRVATQQQAQQSTRETPGKQKIYLTSIHNYTSPRPLTPSRKQNSPSTASHLPKEFQNKMQLVQTQKKRLINNPYKMGMNFISSSHEKVFPNPQASIGKEKGKGKFNRMLAQVRDVEFVTDSYEDSAVQVNSQLQLESDRKKQKISIQKLLCQFRSHALVQNAEHSMPPPQKTIQNNEEIGKELTKIKIGHMLTELSRKIKRFESEEVNEA